METGRWPRSHRWQAVGGEDCLADLYDITVALTARDTDAIRYSTVIEYDLKRRDEPAAMREALRVAGFTREN
jgi:hypothetical protein